MPAQKKYNPKFHDPWAWSLASKGATDEEIAAAFGVARKTIQRWSWRKETKPVIAPDGKTVMKTPDGKTVTKTEKVLTSFGEALQSGKEAADAQVELSLYKRCLGYDVEEEEKVIDVHKDGSSKIGRITTRKRHIPPDTMAIMYWLNNRSRKTGEWSQRQEVSLSNDTGGNVTIFLPQQEVDTDE